MKFDQSLQKRIITGIIGVALLIAIVIFGGKVGVTLLSAALVILCSFEYFHLFFPAQNHNVFKWVGMFLTFFLFTIFSIELPELYFLVIFVLLIFSLFILALILARDLTTEELPELVTSLGYILIGAIYLALAFSFLPKLREQSQIGITLTFVSFLIPWAGDTGAFFVGKQWGKRPLFKVISPAKTVEGLWGGIVLCVACLFLARWLFFPELSFFDCVALGILGTIISHLGDLFESLLKRSRGVKDSGFLIPGHGGFLDRFDGFMFVVPFLYFYSMLFM
ncbi:phosphatidate cytidylyltransferase [Bdellovibrionota bacterium]